MDQCILHFLTGTMAFRSPMPDFWRNGAENPDAFLEKCSTKRIVMQDKLQILLDMQEICRTQKPRHIAGRREKYAGEKRIGERPDRAEKIRQGDT